MSRKALIVKCPNCQRDVEWTSANNSRPFCSERCKLIDLGEWASEAHVIPGEIVTPEELDIGEDSYFQ